MSQQVQRRYLTTLKAFNATDNYTYTDGMNRLNGASESSVWAYIYIYDWMSAVENCDVLCPSCHRAAHQ